MLGIYYYTSAVDIQAWSNQWIEAKSNAAYVTVFIPLGFCPIYLIFIQKANLSRRVLRGERMSTECCRI